MKSTNELVKVSLMLAIALVFQIFFRQFGQMVVGVLINLALLMTVMTTSKVGASMVGVMTPLVAFMLGIMKFIQLVPLIAIGNVVYIIVFGIIYSKKNKIWTNGIGVIVAGIAKFTLLFFGARLILPIFMEQVPPPIYVTFGVIQLYTAVLGGLLALALAIVIPNRYKSEK